jgi:ribosomal protein L40E
MTRISFSCPQCSKAFTTDATAAGKTARCPACSHQFTVPHPNRHEDKAAPILVEATLVEATAPPQRTKKCRFCGEDIAVAAAKCKHCGEWLQRPPGLPGSQTGIKVVSPANAVIFTIITLGIYQVFWLYRVFKELHDRGSTETTPGKAVGFLFIPFFNFVWLFIVWKRLGDSIAHEYTNAAIPVPATGLVWLAPVANLFGFAANFAPPLAVIQLILLPIVIGNAQAWMNRLVAMPAGLSTAPAQLGRSQVDQSKVCPTCGERLSFDALQCRYCGHAFSSSDVAALRQQQDAHAARTALEIKRRSLSSRKTLSHVFGWILTVVGALFSLICVCAFIASFGDPKAPPDLAFGMILVLVIFCGPPLAVGIFLLRAARKRAKELSELPGDPFVHNK